MYSFHMDPIRNPFAPGAGTPPPAHTDPAPSFLPQNVLGLALVALLFVYHFIVSPPLAP